MTEQEAPEPKCGSMGLKQIPDCQRPAGWGTMHPGFGRCKNHDGKPLVVRLTANLTVSGRDLARVIQERR